VQYLRSAFRQGPQQFQFGCFDSPLISEITSQLVLVEKVVQCVGGSSSDASFDRYHECSIRRNLLHYFSPLYLTKLLQPMPAALVYTATDYSGIYSTPKVTKVVTLF